MPAGYYPIIYVRGFAATAGEIDAAVDDPFCGFNLGATAHRASDEEEWAERVAFEGPLVRLMHDHGYVDTIEDSQHNQVPRAVAHPVNLQRTVWIFRYYDERSRRFPGRKTTRDEMLELANQLYDFIGEVRAKTGSSRVHLVAHSMGGLICRCVIQKIYASKSPSGAASDRQVGEIARLFTYGTPHNGIASQYAAIDLFRQLATGIGLLGTDVFDHDWMFRYLAQAGTRREDFVANRMEGFFPLEDVFCLVGTNAADYPVAAGASRAAIGPDSDGLVLIRNAYVAEAGRIHVHRAHSGPYGIVNSEEAYHHLVNFLFHGLLEFRIKPSTDAPPNPDSSPPPPLVDVIVARPGAAEAAATSSREKFSVIRLPADFRPGKSHVVLTLPVPPPSASAPLHYRIAFGLYSPRAGRTRYATPDWTGVAELYAQRARTLRLAWVDREDDAEIGSTLTFPVVPGKFRFPFSLEVAWRGEWPEPDAWGARLEPPLSPGGGGPPIPKEQSISVGQSWNAAETIRRSVARKRKLLIRPDEEAGSAESSFVTSS